MKTTLIYTESLRKIIFQTPIEIRKFRVQKGFEMSNAWLIQCRNSARKNLKPCGSKIKIHGKPLISNWFVMKTTLIYTQRLRKTIFQRRIEIRTFRVQKGFEMSNAWLIQCRNSARKNLKPCGSKIKIHGKPLISNWFVMKTTLIYTQRLRETIFQRSIEIRKFRVQKRIEMPFAWRMEYRKSDFENLNPSVSKIKIHGKNLWFPTDFSWKLHLFTLRGWEKLFFKEE